MSGKRSANTLQEKYVGKIYPSKSYGDVVVKSVESSTNIVVEFLRTGYEYAVTTAALSKGKLKDAMQPTVLGVGIVGCGRYAPATHKKHYSLWSQMLSRCHSNFYPKRDAYKGCSVAPEFLHFQKFSAWCDNQTGFNMQGFVLDKDLLSTGTVKVYSPETCCFIPNEVNLLLIKRKSKLGFTGVKNTKCGSYVAVLNLSKSSCEKTCDRDHLGTYKTPEEAYDVYKRAKEVYVKVVAEKWKYLIDVRAYDALMNWTVEITD